ncbi:hypothetical protein PPACK8108_LOCUS22475 [Phakopsora pachyrhizi]|uniref:Uncharacterized protein n=1 Tax=Phakopsora pachyrhizi TaxID=170000 RepID=A0AAV0BM11_PHAPC|nr:hypothetical protein PPACK8108_LOCUS22475 [Phakopsora pachyrhizi]
MHARSLTELHIHEGKEVTGGLQGRLKGNGWCHWKEEKKLGGGSHQGQSGWRKTTGATDL